MANTENLGFNAGAGTLGGYKFEPLRHFRWELVIINFNEFEKIKLALKTCSRPNIVQESITVEHFNDRFYLAGKTNYNEISCSAYDAIPDSPTGLYVSQMMQNWKHLIFDPKTNIMLPGADYKKDGILTMYDGAGNEQMSYKILGMWPATVKFSDLDYGSNDPAMVDITFKIDKAFIQ